MPRTGPRSELRLRRLVQQRLAGTPGASVPEVVRWFGAVQAQDVAGAKWAVALRTAGATDDEVEAALDAGTILRTHVLRPTWHLVAPEDLRGWLRLTAARVKRALGYNDRKLGLTARIVARGEAVIARALAGGAARTREELGEALADAGIDSAGQRLAHLLMHAELDAVICSGPRRDRKHTYVSFETRVSRARETAREPLLAELARRYFRSHGPAGVEDFAWWSGLTLGEAREAVALAGEALTEETIAGRRRWCGEAAPPAKSPRGRLLLLPNYDEFIVGLSDRAELCAPETLARLPLSSNGAGGILSNVVVEDGGVIGVWRREVMRARVEIMATVFTGNAPGEKAWAEAARRYERFCGLPTTVQVERAGGGR